MNLIDQSKRVKIKKKKKEKEIRSKQRGAQNRQMPYKQRQAEHAAISQQGATPQAH